MEAIDTLTDTLTPVNCVVCRREFEVFAGSLEPDEDYVCDTCYDFLTPPNKANEPDKKGGSQN